MSLKDWLPWLRHEPEFNYSHLQNELQCMPTDQKLAAARDIYGIDLSVGRDVQVQETSRFIRDKLEQLDEAIDDAEEEGKEAYETALFVNKEYVASVEFRLMFLRAASYDVEAAATRMIKYWERKVDLFGADRAFRPIIMVLDVDLEDQEAFASGGFRLLPQPDEAGRAILFCCPVYWDGRPEHVARSMGRLLWCMVHAAVEHPELGENVQKKGLVGLVGNGSAPSSAPFVGPLCSRSAMQFAASVYKDFNQALPVRGKAMHHFLSAKWVKCLVEYHLNYMSPALRARYIQYDGSIEENLTKLTGFGIHPHRVPPELGGSLEFNYQEWMQWKMTNDSAAILDQMDADG